MATIAEFIVLSSAWVSSCCISMTLSAAAASLASNPPVPVDVSLIVYSKGSMEDASPSKLQDALLAPFTGSTSDNK